MNNNRTGGLLLVIGMIAGTVTMVLHPTGHAGLLSPHEMQTLAWHDRAVHALALASLPLMFLGTLALTRHLSAAGTGTSGLPLAALVVYGFALVAVMAAGAMDGFVAADILSRMVEGDPKLESRRMLLDYTFRINQAFAAIYVVGCSAAIVLWSVALLRGRPPVRGIGFYGVILGVLTTGAMFAGHLSPDVHGFGLVVFTQAVWFILTGILLMRTAERAA